MKKLGFILMACALIFGTTQCKKNDETNSSENSGESVFITLNVGGGTRAEVVPEDDIAPVYYAEGDMIHVVSDGKYIGTLTYNGSDFTGNITNPTEGQPLHFYFLGNVTPSETLVVGETSTCSIVISDQTISHPVVSYAPSNQSYSEGTTNYTATLLNKCALVKFNVTTVSENATCITGMNNKVTVDFETNEFEYGQEGEGVITLSVGNGEKWVILLPQDAVDEGIAYSVDGVYSGIRGAVPVILDNDYLTTGIEVEITTPNGNNHDFVDLGLPSGTLWATCNVGADSPQAAFGYGYYFAWGETQPKNTYNWSTYQYCNGSYNTLTKYCNDFNFGYNGFTDNLTTLLPEDDAATINWGANWRMPTMEEWQELIDNTTVTWTTQNGLEGKLFTASNGNSLFLPAAGRYDGSSLTDFGSEMHYWSSSLRTDYPRSAWSFYYLWSDYGMSGLSARYFGFSVRPVLSMPRNYNINVIVNPTEGGLVNGGGTYQEGTNCMLTAIATEGYVFHNWMENGEVVSTETTYSFMVNENRTLVANFVESDYDYVDLGLPSGLLWATRNVGADAPEDYGDYFAWGETTPKVTYEWNTYQYCMGSEYTLIKYCYSSIYGYNGFTDNLTTLLPEDDAATANWGNDWRMPTNDEWAELCQNTTCTWTTQNGVNGRLFTASNGNSLFLPAAGWCWGSGLTDTDRGHYWSSSLATYIGSHPTAACMIVFRSDYYREERTSRFAGLCIRAVRSAL
jgi:hypothetical protein